MSTDAGQSPSIKPTWLERATFDALLEMANGAPCCGAPWGKEGCGSVDDLTVDHLVPRYSGGTNDVSNLQFLCRPCNSSKGIRPSEYWKQKFFWDVLPDEAGFRHLREPQRRLFREIAVEREDWFGRRLLGDISHHLYANLWVVGAGKTIGIAAAAWGLNFAIRKNWGGAARRVDRILVIVKDQALRDQIADSLRTDLVKYEIVQDAPRVGVVASGSQFGQYAWIDRHDVVVACEQQLWEANGNARGDLAEILARFPLIAFDEPHYAPEQISRIIDAAHASLCVGFTGTPMDMWGNLLGRVVNLTRYDYQEASASDRSLKYLDASDRHFRTFVRELGIDEAEVIEHGTLTTKGDTSGSGYNKNIEVAKAVIRAVVEEMKSRDEIVIAHEPPAPHRRQPDVDVSLLYPVHAIVYFDNIGDAEALAKSQNEMFDKNRERFPEHLGYKVEIAHSGGKARDGRTRAPRPLARKQGERPHPWMRSRKQGGLLDKECARILFVVDMAREGLDNPYCGIVGVACNSRSVLDAVQGWLGRQLRAVFEYKNGRFRVPPMVLDTVKIVTHHAYQDVVPTIRAGIDFLINMSAKLEALPTIKDLEEDSPTPAERIERELELPVLDKVKIAAAIGEQDAAGQPADITQLIREFAPLGGARADRVREWAETVRESPMIAREELRLARGIQPVIIVMRERIRHEPSDAELERYIRIHQPELAPDLPVADYNRRFFVAMHKQYADQFQSPPLPVETDREGKPLTINTLARLLVGRPVLSTLQGRFTCDTQLVWRYATSAVSRKLDVPEGVPMKDGSDWDTPQSHALVRRPEIQRELVAYVIRRLIDEGHCPALERLRQPEVPRDGFA